MLLSRFRIFAVLICLMTSVGCNQPNNAEVAKEKARADATEAELAKAKAELEAAMIGAAEEKARADATATELAKLKVAQPQPMSVDADRRAAEWALRADAHTVNVVADGFPVEILKGGKLPDGPFTVTAINLTHCIKVTDDGTERLNGLKSIRTLILDGTPIAKLDFLDEMANLEVLDLQNTGVTDESLAHIKGLTKLRYLKLLMFFGNNKLTDAGLEHLKASSNLDVLHLEGTKVTDAGVKSLQAALPKCKISK